MKIENIKIKNFRSIKEVDIKPEDFNVFIGQNNHGKTNFFEAIEWFYSPKGNLEDIKRKGASDDEEIEVELIFSGVKDGINKMKNEKKKTTMEKIIKDTDTIKIKRTSENQKSRSIFKAEDEKWVSAPTGFDGALNDLLPKLEYVKTQTNLKDIIKYGKNTPIADMLSDVLEIILEEDKKYREFKETFEKLFRDSDSKVKQQLDGLSNQVKLYLVKQFSECTKVEFRVNDPVFEDLLKNFETKVDDGVETSAEEKGDGMQRALMLAIIQAYADFRNKKGEKAKNFIFLIDEGELHLHPTAQRKLKDALLDLSRRGDQILINTHSSVLVTDDVEEQAIFKVEKHKMITNIGLAQENEKPYLIFELLGGSPADLLLPNNFLIVEGKSDLLFIRKIIERFYDDKVKIQIVYSEGDYKKQSRSLDGINTVLVPLNTSPLYKKSLVVLCEEPQNDRKKGFESFKKSYKHLVDNKQFFELPNKSIEEYYPEPWEKTKEEVKEMKCEEKKELAEKVASEIDKKVFEDNMIVIYSSLLKCWELAYK